MTNNGAGGQHTDAEMGAGVDEGGDENAPGEG